jgi:hypothetical protein
MKKGKKVGKKTRDGMAPTKGKQGFNTASMKKLELRLIKTYPRQIVWDVWLPGNPLKETTTVTTGTIASVYQVREQTINSFATRFGSTFVEYRIVQADVFLRLFSATNPGVIQVWFDEQSNATPTLAEAGERYISSVNASAVDESPSWTWTAGDPLDLQYTPIAGSVTPVTFKFFTNNANFGSSIVATDYFEIQSRLRVQFRGLMGV